MSEKEAFPSAYSSFAVSVDSRNAERPSYSTPPSDTGSGILRQTRPTSAYGFHEKKRSLSPRSQDRFESRNAKPSVRFTKDIIHEYTQGEPSPLHHRRSSTAAFIDYIRTHLPESDNGGSLNLTPKRALLLFAVSACKAYHHMTFVSILNSPRFSVCLDRLLCHLFGSRLAAIHSWNRRLRQSSHSCYSQKRWILWQLAHLQRRG